MSAAGFIVNQEKSSWIPQQRVKWLGFHLDSLNNIFDVPQEKIVRLLSTIKNVEIFQDNCTARNLAKCVGKITSLFHALGTVVYIMTKNCQAWIAARDSWNIKAILPKSVLDELDFWAENLVLVQKMPFEKISSEASVIIYSDASSTGAGAFILDNPGSELVEFWKQWQVQLGES